MKALVTGASGFLGQGLCSFLIQKGFKVHALVRPTSNKSQLKHLPLHFFTGDVTHPHSLEQAGQGVDVIFHLAGVVSHSNKDLPIMKAVNVEGTKHVVKLARTNKAKLIHISSVVAVGASNKPKVLNENSPFEPSLSQLGYFETKKIAEQLVQAACKKGQISAVILNPSTIYGPGDMQKQSRNIQQKIADGKFPFYPTKGGVSVVDLQSVVTACVKALEKGLTGERYILSGENISIKKLFTLIAKAGGVRPPFIPLKPFMLYAMAFFGQAFYSLSNKNCPITKQSVRLSTMYHWFDNQKAKTELGFKPLTAMQAIKNSVTAYKANKA